MNVRITFRHMDASEAVKQHTRQKLAKLQKFLREPMTASVTLSLDKLKHVAETRVASGGLRHEAKEASDDMYTSIDKVMDKLERQIRGTKGVKQARARRSGATLRLGKKPALDEAKVASSRTSSKKAPAKAKKTKKPSSKSKKVGSSRKKSARA